MSATVEIVAGGVVGVSIGGKWDRSARYVRLAVIESDGKRSGEVLMSPEETRRLIVELQERLSHAI